jgi:DNA sulfur modification protein DndB
MASLNPTNGHVIAGAAIDEHRFVGRVKAAQLFQLAPDPRDTEIKKRVDASKELQDLQSVRAEVQRLFEGAKRRNVGPYADYIIGLREGGDGITPPITLYSEKPLLIDEREDGTAFIQVPWDERLIAIDGETQLAARHEAASKNPETKQDFVPVYICHGHDKQWARQSFHDLNTLGVRPNSALSIGMDARDPITRVCRTVERGVPLFKDRVNKVRRQLRNDDPHIVTITTLRGACVTLAKGISGVQYGARPVPIADEQLKQVEDAALDWFAAVAQAIGPSLEDRETKLASSPAVLAAIGALGHQLVAENSPDERRAKATVLAGGLKRIDWTRGRHWDGVAGKIGPKGTYAVGGVKEYAYAVYSALTDPVSSGYGAIRPSAQAA